MDESIVRKFVEKDILKVSGIYREMALYGSSEYNGGEQILYIYHVAYWDTLRNIYSLFVVKVLTDKDNVLESAVYDERDKKYPLLTTDLVKKILNQKSSYDLRNNNFSVLKSRSW